MFNFPINNHDYYADEVGLTLAGLFVRESNGLPRTGFLAVRPVISAVSGSWRVRVGIFTYVHQVNGAVTLSGIETPQEIDILPAAGNIPAGQARIDRILYNPVTAAVSVVTGTPSTSPVNPPSGGLVDLARVRVNAGDGGVLQAQMADTFKMTTFSSLQSEWKQANSAAVAYDRVALRNGWVNQINANWNGLNTRFTYGGVEITGAVSKPSSYAALETIGLLPPFMRPSVPTLISAGYGSAGGYALVRPTGEIVTALAGNAGQIALGGTIYPELF